MNRAYSYHIIDHFTPPSLEADKEIQDTQLRLESITACLILKDKNKCNFLSQIPLGLHIVIWKAYLREKYYSHRDSSSHYDDDLPLIDFSDISELLHHWPKEEFTLKEIMPSLPSRLSWFSYFLDEGSDKDWKYGPPLDRSKNYLQKFYAEVSNTILENFVKSKTKDFFHTHKDVCKIRKLDISGFVSIWHSCYQPHDKSYILEYIKSVENQIGNAADNIEIICDAEITLKNDKILEYDGKLLDSDSDEEFESDIEDIELDNVSNDDPEDINNENPEDIDNEDPEDIDNEDPEVINNEDAQNINNEDAEDNNDEDEDSYDEYSKDFGKKKMNAISLASSYALSSNSIFRYSCLTFIVYKCTKHVAQVIRKFINESTVSLLRIENMPVGFDIIKDVFEATSHQMNIISLELGGHVFSLNFLQYFKNLKHLDLSNIDLHGKLDPLLHMEKGLHFLCLRACKLNNSDLDVLLRSCHKSSLLELDICSNKLSENSTNLIKLCQALPSIIMLELESCRLGELSNNDLSLLCKSFISLPNLVYLALDNNDLNMDTIKSHLISLSASPSLRLLILDMANTEQESTIITTMMNQKRSELLYVQSRSPF